MFVTPTRTNVRLQTPERSLGPRPNKNQNGSGGTMKATTTGATTQRNLPNRNLCRNLAWIAALFVVLSPPPVRAQSQATTGVMVAQAAELTDNGGLGPAEIVARVRAAGFEARSRPVQRGNVFFLFALDRHYMDVRLTVDANSGRVLSATRLAGTRFGGPGYDGHEASRLYERPPVPPANIPNRGAARSDGPATAPAAAASAPLPRARPGDGAVGAEVQAQAPVTTPPAGLGDTTAEAPPPAAAAPPPSASPPQPAPRPQPPTMVPIAPLE
jgi:hypothetical protein